MEAEKKELPLFGGKPRSECRSTCVLKKGNDFATLAPAAEDGDDSTFPGFASCVKVPSLLENEIISKKQTPFSVHVRDSVQVDPSQGDYPPFALSYPKVSCKISDAPPSYSMVQSLVHILDHNRMLDRIQTSQK